MPRNIAVITPATGRSELRACAESVAWQTYRDLEHVIVVDGRERSRDVHELINGILPRPRIVELFEPTGRDNYNGHRIYGAMPYLMNSRWVAFLDEDNWLDRGHFESLTTLAETHSLQWAYALRKIVAWNGRFVCNDNCNSLGWWPSFDGGYNHVDTNCYLIDRAIAVRLSSVWNRRSGVAGYETADRALCAHLLKEFPMAFTTGEYTVNYRVGSRSDMAIARAFYKEGNSIMASIYRKFPWTTMRLAGRLAEHPCLAWEVADKSVKMQKSYARMWSQLSPLYRNGELPVASTKVPKRAAPSRGPVG